MAISMTSIPREIQPLPSILQRRQLAKLLELYLVSVSIQSPSKAFDADGTAQLLLPAPPQDLPLLLEHLILDQ